MALDIKNLIDENPLDTVYPEDVFSELAKEISEITNDIVNVSVNTYEGSLCSYKYNPVATVVSSMFGSMEHDIQDDLGVIGNNYSNKFEFLIESKQLPGFSFRLFLAGSEIAGYPCKIVMEQGFADEINKGTENKGYTYIAKNSNELKQLLYKALKSDKFISLVKQIVSAANRRLKLLDSSHE